jgi:putative two-component system response regulator
MEKQKILIVDDSEMNRSLLIDILENQYDVVEVENGV